MQVINFTKIKTVCQHFHFHIFMLPCFGSLVGKGGGGGGGIAYEEGRVYKEGIGQIVFSRNKEYNMNHSAAQPN